jgi:glycosyltransferase involved in cell wall biosynthesis
MCLAAVAAGCPIVAMRSSGPDAILTDRVDGLLAVVGDGEGLSHTVLCLLHKDALRGRISENPRPTVAEKLSLESFSKRVSGIYKDILKGKSRRTFEPAIISNENQIAMVCANW